MKIKNRIAGLATAGLLVAAGLGLSATAPAQAASSCPNPDNGYMCVHIHNTDTDSWYWFGPWYTCTTHTIPLYDQVTWVEDNQYSGTESWFYDYNGTQLGTMTAKINDRPPGYVSSDLSYTYKIKVC